MVQFPSGHRLSNCYKQTKESATSQKTDNEFKASDSAKVEKWVFRENPHQTCTIQPISTKRYTPLSDRTDYTQVKFH